MTIFSAGVRRGSLLDYDEIVSTKSGFKVQTGILAKTIVEFFNIILLRERSDTLVLDDSKPGIREIKTLVMHPVSKLKRKMQFQLRSTKYYRNLRLRQFKHAIFSAKKILFVCKGNICRSPFAEYYSRTIFPEKIQVDSCGYIQQDGRESPPEAISTAKKFGVDLSDHRAHQVTDEMIRNSDMIVVFDESNFRMISQRYSACKSKLWFLSEICPALPVSIEDPFRKEDKDFEQAYSRISLLY
jgi:protein-tyrosine-phosphatase